MWDIRDKEGDEASGVHTIPVVLGINNAKIIIMILALSAMLVSDQHVASTPIVAVWSAIMSLLANKDRPNWFYHLFLYVDILIIWFF